MTWASAWIRRTESTQPLIDVCAAGSDRGGVEWGIHLDPDRHKPKTKPITMQATASLKSVEKSDQIFTASLLGIRAKADAG